MKKTIDDMNKLLQSLTIIIFTMMLAFLLILVLVWYVHTFVY